MRIKSPRLTGSRDWLIETHSFTATSPYWLPGSGTKRADAPRESVVHAKEMPPAVSCASAASRRLAAGMPFAHVAAPISTVCSVPAATFTVVVG